MVPALLAAACLGGLANSSAQAQNKALDARIAQLTAQEGPKVVAWRRDLHEHPELGNEETRTAGIIAAHLKALGLEVQTGVARTGVLGLLRGGKPGPVVALRADMGLPLTETSGLPFASKVTTTYLTQVADYTPAWSREWAKMKRTSLRPKPAAMGA